MAKLLGIDILKGYVGCFGAKILAINNIGGVSFGRNLDVSNNVVVEGNIALDNSELFNVLGAWQGKLIIPLVSNFCFATRQPTISRVWNDQIKRQIVNVDISFKISPTLSANALMEYLGIDSSGISNFLNNNPISQTLGVSMDLNNIQNPFLLLVSTMLAKRQRTPVTYMNVGDMYYAWKVQTANIVQEGLFLNNYTIDYEVGDVVLNLTSYIAPSIRGQAEPYLYQSLQAGNGFL